MSDLRCKPPTLTFITDGQGDVQRIDRILQQAVPAGLTCVQLREPRLSAAELAELCALWRPRLNERGGQLWVNDRADVAAANLCDGVWLGHRSLPPEVVRSFLPDQVAIGCSAHDAEQVRSATRRGADLISLAPVFPTQSKPGHLGLGVSRARALVERTTVPVLLLGGICQGNLRELAETDAAGAMVMRAISAATDVGAAVKELRQATDELFRSG